VVGWLSRGSSQCGVVFSPSLPAFPPPTAHARGHARPPGTARGNRGAKQEQGGCTHNVVVGHFEGLTGVCLGMNEVVREVRLSMLRVQVERRVAFGGDVKDEKGRKRRRTRGGQVEGKEGDIIFFLNLLLGPSMGPRQPSPGSPRAAGPLPASGTRTGLTSRCWRWLALGFRGRERAIDPRRTTQTPRWPASFRGGTLGSSSDADRAIRIRTAWPCESSEAPHRQRCLNDPRPCVVGWRGRHQAVVHHVVLLAKMPRRKAGCLSQILVFHVHCCLRAARHNCPLVSYRLRL
jgi:hypothetical protein